jgi:hypothetical protein
MLTGLFADTRWRGIASFGVMVIHTLGWKKNTKF